MNDGPECFLVKQADLHEAIGPDSQTLSEESLLCGFMEFYSTFEFDRKIISPLQGKLIPVEINSDFKICDMNVQDPFEVNFNPARNVQDCVVRSMQRHMIEFLENQQKYMRKSDSCSWGIMNMLESEKSTISPAIVFSIPVIEERSEVCDLGEKNDCYRGAYVQSLSKICKTITDRLGVNMDMDSSHPLVKHLNISDISKDASAGQPPLKKTKITIGVTGGDNSAEESTSGKRKRTVYSLLTPLDLNITSTINSFTDQSSEDTEQVTFEPVMNRETLRCLMTVRPDSMLMKFIIVEIWSVRGFAGLSFIKCINKLLSLLSKPN